MPENLGEAVLELSTDDSALESGIDKAKGQADDLGKSFTGAADLIKGAFAAIGIGLSLKEVLDSTIEAEKAEMLLANAVRATGQAAGFSAEQLKAQAAVLAQATGTSDEGIMNMQRTLLTFRNIHGDVFREASKLTLDFAAATGRDASDAARTLGMALNDPVNSLGKLKLAGVAVTDTLKDQIETMVTNGDLVGAQSLLLKELEGAYGGTALAARNTLGGALNALKENFGDLFLEQKALGDTLRNFVELVNSSLPGIASLFSATFGGINAAVEGVVEKLFFLGQGLFKLVTLDLAGAMESFGQMPTVLDIATQSVSASTTAWNETSEAMLRANESHRALAASAPITAGVVAKSAKQMQDSLMVTTKEYGKVTQAELDRYKGVEEDVKKFNEIAKKQEEESKKRNAERIQNFDSTMRTISTLTQSHNSTLAAIGKAAAITTSVRDTYVAANKALASAPPPFNFGLVAAVVAAGFENVNRIRAMEHGGRVAGGETVMVGEVGPELFTAPRSGYIVPNSDLGNMGGTTVNNNINVSGLDFGDERTAEKILAGIADAAKRGTQEAIAASNTFNDLSVQYAGRAA